jgi:cytochrome c553
MNRSLAVRGGRRKKINRLKKYGKKALRYAKTGAKVAAGAAAALALCTATGTCPELSKRTGSGRMYSRLQTKVDDAIKRKLNEYGQELGKGVLQGAEADRLMDKGHAIVQTNIKQIEELAEKVGVDIKDVIDQADDTKIASFMGYVTGKKGNKNDPITKNDEDETKKDLNNSTSAIGWLLGYS